MHPRHAHHLQAQLRRARVWHELHLARLAAHAAQDARGTEQQGLLSSLPAVDAQGLLEGRPGMLPMGHPLQGQQAKGAVVPTDTAVFGHSTLVSFSRKSRPMLCRCAGRAGQAVQVRAAREGCLAPHHGAFATLLMGATS